MDHKKEMAECTDKCLKCPERTEMMPIDLERWCLSCPTHKKLRTLEKTNGKKHWAGALDKFSMQGKLGEQ
ncbi:MAG: hypothetical protein LBQ05_02070 [Christensenellaceae bacterium]|jgi:hypothetical protein|nr:hypothetical protein [Christensenellaceae bacterium]